jgi:hypothetical protein
MKSEQAKQEELKKYKTNEIIQKLNLSDVEFRKYLYVIKQMIDKPNESDYLTELVRINGRLEVKTIIKEHIVRHLRIRNNYLIKTFPDQDLKITLTKEYFTKVDPSKARILN